MTPRILFVRGVAQLMLQHSKKMSPYAIELAGQILNCQTPTHLQRFYEPLKRTGKVLKLSNDPAAWYMFDASKWLNYTLNPEYCERADTPREAILALKALTLGDSDV